MVKLNLISVKNFLFYVFIDVIKWDIVLMFGSGRIMILKDNIISFLEYYDFIYN